MASYALGVSIHLEEAYASGDESAGKKIDRVKELLVSILGAVGDKLFWSTNQTIFIDNRDGSINVF